MSTATITFSLFGRIVTLNPNNSFTVFGHVFYWYGVIIAAGFLLAVLYTTYYAKEYGLTGDNIVDMLIFAVPLAIICARLYYVIFYFSLFQDDLSKIYKIWEGGLAIYGGIIGGVTGALIYSKVKKIPLAPILDVCSFGLLIGQAVGRWGNFINREAYGSETALPWKMGLITRTGINYYHPTFLYESVWNVLGLIIIHFFFRKKRKFDGEIFLLYVAWYGFGRMFIESLRTDSLFLFDTKIRVSLLLGLVSMLAALIILLIKRFSKKNDPQKMFVNTVAAKASDASIGAEKEDEEIPHGISDKGEPK